ncbi:unnamed protein product [Rotaria magnacalcarata]|uniref:Cytochrome P450 n=1 Tax=Rotaria magnacalcarata TaxID=392030 RepID=A0A819N2Y3_9BILA|nr:unnamed protein product [Rotaria magnacalcarata]
MLIIVALLIVISLLYLVLKHRYYTNPDDEIPGSPLEFFFGHSQLTGLLSGKALPVIVSELQQSYSDVFTFWCGHKRSIVLNTIEHVPYVFANRQIYEQGSITADEFSLVVPFPRGSNTAIYGHRISAVKPRKAGVILSYSIEHTAVLLPLLYGENTPHAAVKEVLRHAPVISAITRNVLYDDAIGKPSELDREFSNLKSKVPVARFHSLCLSWMFSSTFKTLFIQSFLGEDYDYHPYAFLPFSGGHRICTGRELAFFELKTIITRLMQFITFIDCNENIGGYQQKVICFPKNLAVTVRFDKD